MGEICEEGGAGRDELDPYRIYGRIYGISSCTLSQHLKLRLFSRASQGCRRGLAVRDGLSYLVEVAVPTSR